MEHFRVWKAVKVLMMIAIAVTVFGEVVMRLWNWLMPGLFHLPMITFVQALGLLVLSKLLFGGFHRHSGGRGWKRGMNQRWEQMSPEERERFRAGLKSRRGWCRPAETDGESAAV
jgi:hypothetical protein